MNDEYQNDNYGVQLSPMQEKLYALFKGKEDKDILIKDMYYALYGTPTDALVTVRDMQQRLAPVLQRLNDKLVTQRIEPGLMKQTYRVVAVPFI